MISPDSMTPDPHPILPMGYLTGRWYPLGKVVISLLPPWKSGGNIDLLEYINKYWKSQVQPGKSIFNSPCLWEAEADWQIGIYGSTVSSSLFLWYAKLIHQTSRNML